MITSYRRLAYSSWEALGACVHSSVGSYLGNREALEGAFRNEGRRLSVRITYDKYPGRLEIADSAMGMGYEEIDATLNATDMQETDIRRSGHVVGLTPTLCWLGNEWTIRTKKLGEAVEHQVGFRVDEVAARNGELLYNAVEGKHTDLHYTVVDIRDMTQRFAGRACWKIRNFLSSRYRAEFASGFLAVTWNGMTLT